MRDGRNLTTWGARGMDSDFIRDGGLYHGDLRENVDHQRGEEAWDTQEGYA